MHFYRTILNVHCAYDVQTMHDVQTGDLLYIFDCSVSGVQYLLRVVVAVVVVGKKFKIEARYGHVPFHNYCS